MSRKEPMKLILDMDTGVDDAVAIALAANCPEFELLAITTVAGNAPVDACTRNCLLLTGLLGLDVPVSRGAEAPLAKELLTAPEVHGEDGLGGAIGTLPEPAGAATEERAADLLTRLPREHPGEITLVTTGPLTNVANALAADPDALALYRRVVSMGGAFNCPGNTGPVGEFNVYVDPEAAAAVFSAVLDVTLVPLDATTGAILSRASLEAHALAACPSRNEPGMNLAAIMYRAIDYYMRFQFGESGLDGGYMHDPLAVAAALDPNILRTTTSRVEVVLDGPDRGLTRAKPAAAGHGLQLALGHDDLVFGKLLEERVLTPVFGGPR